MPFDCPVCGYRKLRRPPLNYLICPSCGTEFGYHDFAETPERRNERWESLRARWIAREMPWHSRVTQPPPDWDAAAQLIHAGFGYSIGLPVELAPTSESTIYSDRFWTNSAALIVSINA